MLSELWPKLENGIVVHDDESLPSGVASYTGGQAAYLFAHDWAGNFLLEGCTSSSTFSLFFSNVVKYFLDVLKVKKPEGEKLSNLLKVGKAVSIQVSLHFAAKPSSLFVSEYSQRCWESNAKAQMGQGLERMIDLYINIPLAAPVAAVAGLESLRSRVQPRLQLFENLEFIFWNQSDQSVRQKSPTKPIVPERPPVAGTSLSGYTLSCRARTGAAYGFCTFPFTGKNGIRQPVSVASMRLRSFTAAF